MLIEYTPEDIERRDSLKDKYRSFTPDVWKKADSFEDAIELFEKYERTPEEMREFNQHWSEEGGDDNFGEEPYDYDDEEDDWMFEDDEEEGGW